MIANVNTSKTLTTQTSFDKENNARNANITSQGDRNNFYSRKVKKLQEISNKSSNALLENIETVRAANPLANLVNKPLVARNHEDIDISRKLNTQRVKKTLNFDDVDDDLNTMCDESHSSSVYSVNSLPHKTQDDKMSLEKDKTSAMQVELERKRCAVEVNNNKMVEEESTKQICSELAADNKESPERSYQNRLLEKYASCILKTFKEKDVNQTYS